MAGAGRMLKQGLADLDAASIEAVPGSSGFAGLTFEQQTGLLQAIETTSFSQLFEKKETKKRIKDFISQKKM